jgi:hypothetical protein
MRPRVLGVGGCDADDLPSAVEGEFDVVGGAKGLICRAVQGKDAALLDADSRAICLCLPAFIEPFKVEVINYAPSLLVRL